MRNLRDEEITKKAKDLHEQSLRLRREIKRHLEETEQMFLLLEETQSKTRKLLNQIRTQKHRQ